MLVRRGLLVLALAVLPACSSDDEDPVAVGCDVDVLHEALEDHYDGDIADFGMDDVDCDGDYAFARVEQPAGSGEYGFVTYFRATGDGTGWEVLVAGNDPGDAADHDVPQDVWDGLGDE